MREIEIDRKREREKERKIGTIRKIRKVLIDLIDSIVIRLDSIRSDR